MQSNPTSTYWTIESFNDVLAKNIVLETKECKKRKEFYEVPLPDIMYKVRTTYIEMGVTLDSVACVVSGQMIASTFSTRTAGAHYEEEDLRHVSKLGANTLLGGTRRQIRKFFRRHRFYFSILSNIETNGSVLFVCLIPPELICDTSHQIFPQLQHPNSTNNSTLTRGTQELASSME